MSPFQYFLESVSVRSSPERYFLSLFQSDPVWVFSWFHFGPIRSDIVQVLCLESVSVRFGQVLSGYFLESVSVRSGKYTTLPYVLVPATGCRFRLLFLHPGADPARVHWVHVHPPCVRIHVHSVLNARSTPNV